MAGPLVSGTRSNEGRYREGASVTSECVLVRGLPSWLNAGMNTDACGYAAIEARTYRPREGRPERLSQVSWEGTEWTQHAGCQLIPVLAQA